MKHLGLTAFDKVAWLKAGQPSQLTTNENDALLTLIRANETRMGPQRRLRRWLDMGKLPPEMR